MGQKLDSQLLGPGISAQWSALTTFQNHLPWHQSLRALGLICLRLWKAARFHFPSEAGAFQVYAKSQYILDHTFKIYFSFPIKEN